MTAEPEPIGESALTTGPTPPGEPTPTAEPVPTAGPAPTAEPVLTVISPAPPPAPVWPRVGAVLSGSFDLATQARIQIRNVSLYYGLLGLITVGPLVFSVIAEAHRIDFDTLEGVSGWTILAGLIAVLAIIAIGVESQLVGATILGAARVGRPMTLDEALRLSRERFWRYFWAAFAVGIVVGIATLAFSIVLEPVFGPGTDAAPVGANLLGAVVGAPFVYITTGVVLGDVGTSEAIRRSVRLARARFRLAVLASVFAVVAQYLLVFAASAGIDLAVRALEPFRAELEGLDPAQLGGFLVFGLAGLVALLAYFSLTFTIGALTLSPQVVSFLGLTGFSLGLDRARDDLAAAMPAARPARISRPMIVGAVLAWIAAVLAIAGALR
jgi:hypothetical protein